AIGFAAGGGAAAVVFAGGGASFFGGSGTSILSSLDPTLWTTGSPFSVITTWQKMFLCVPAGAAASTLSGNATSFVSLVSFSSCVVTLGGSPTRRMTASPANGLATAGLTNICVSLPCSTAPRSMFRLRYGGAISMVASWLDT